VFWKTRRQRSKFVPIRKKNPKKAQVCFHVEKKNPLGTGGGGGGENPPLICPLQQPKGTLGLWETGKGKRKSSGGQIRSNGKLFNGTPGQRGTRGNRPSDFGELQRTPPRKKPTNLEKKIARNRGGVGLGKARNPKP